MRLTAITAFIGLLMLGGCIGRNLHDNIVPEPSTIDEQHSKIWVNSFYCYDLTNAEIRPALGLQTGDSILPNSWKCNPIKIEGFEYEPGYIYHLEVSQIIIEGLPSYRLSRIISKERDPNYYRLNDIWVITHLNNNALEISERRATIEFNLSDFTISGNAFCNNYSGQFNYYSEDMIAFGPLVSTKMMCPEISTEQEFLKGLEKVRYYEIKGLTLFLLGETHEELLRFQKVD